jgi:hypothetical protein
VPTTVVRVRSNGGFDAAQMLSEHLTDHRRRVVSRYLAPVRVLAALTLCPATAITFRTEGRATDDGLG